MARMLPGVFTGVRWIDAVPALVLFAVGTLDAVTTTEYGGGTARLVVAVALQTLPLAWRRTWTLPVVAISLTGLVVEIAGQPAYGGVYGLLGFLLLVHATARWARGPARWTAVVLLVAGASAQVLSQEDYDGPLGTLGNVVLVVAFAAAAWLAGVLPRDAAARDAARVADRRRAVEEERARISRDLHDVVGHALASISLTAGAARRQPGGGEGEMATALDLIGTTSRDAAADVRRLVGMLRDPAERPGGSPDLDPQPTLAELPLLLERARASGLEVHLEQRGNPRHLAAGLQLTVYRVVQEGLTNVVKHAPGACAVVLLDWTGRALTVSVRDHGGRSAARADPGFGLAGLAERIAVYDGHLATDTHADGFELVAELPVP